jgi:hypothetical protein
MTTTDAYIAAVRSLLSELPAGEREELLEDLAAHLAELAAEPGLSLGDRLGPPSAYAAEFVASAGLTARAGPATDAEPPTPTPPGAWLSDFRPTWWVLRPFLVAAAVVLIVDRKIDAGLPRLLFVVLGGVVAAGAAAWSTRLGRAGGRLNLAWTGVGALAVAAVAVGLSAGTVDRVVFAGPKMAAVKLGIACRAEQGQILRIGPDGRRTVIVTPDGGVKELPGPDVGPGAEPFPGKFVAPGFCTAPTVDGQAPSKPGMTPEPQNSPTPTTTAAPTTTVAPTTTLPPPGP